MWCQKSVFLSQVRNLFGRSSRKWIQTMFSRTIRSGFSFFLFTQNRGIYFGAWFLMPYHITVEYLRRRGKERQNFLFLPTEANCFFVFVKLIKKIKTKSKLRINFYKTCNAREVTPRFCKYHVICSANFSGFFVNFFLSKFPTFYKIFLE